MKAKTYYESDRAVLYVGDADAVLLALESATFDLVVTDPPYGVAFQSNQRTEKFKPIANDKPEDREIVERILHQCVRLTKPGRHMYVFGPEAMNASGAAVSQAVQLVWNKEQQGMGNVDIPWGPAHELLHFYSLTSKDKAGQESPAVRRRRGSVIDAPRRMGLTVRHPTEKPINLLTELIESSSRMDESVLDPFGGVGSTGVAAVLAGRRAVMVELEPEYARIAAARLADAERVYNMAMTV